MLSQLILLMTSRSLLPSAATITCSVGSCIYNLEAIFVSQLKVDSDKSFCKSKTGLNMYHRKIYSKIFLFYYERREKGRKTGKNLNDAQWHLTPSPCSVSSGEIYSLLEWTQLWEKETILSLKKDTNGGLGFG